MIFFAVIRLYWRDFKEIVPPVNGDYKRKEPEIKAGHPGWSVKDGGQYVLFYYRVEQPTDWAYYQPLIPEHTAECEERSWAPALTNPTSAQA